MARKESTAIILSRICSRNLNQFQTISNFIGGTLFGMRTVVAAGKTLSICAKTYSYLRCSRRPEADLVQLKQRWAQETLEKMGLQIQVLGEVSLAPGMLFLGNHVSYLDILLLMATTPGISFVAKKEIGDWPLFGDGARAMDTIFVKRESASERGQAKLAMAEGLEKGKRIALFPSGTTSLERKPWRRGGFEVAKAQGVLIQPFRIRYTPARTAAFIDDDVLLPHLIKLIASKEVKASIEFHQPVAVSDPAACGLRWQEWSEA